MLTLFIILQVYLMPFVNSQGNTVVRVSDESWNVSSQQLQHNYSTDQCFNLDESLLKLAGYPAAILDGDTYEFLYWSNIPSYGRWSNTNAYLIYGTSGTKFVSHHVFTNERTTLRDFGFNVDFGFGESNQDLNDRYVGLIGNSSLIIYNIENNTYITSPYNGGLDWFSVSPLGNYAVANYFDNGLIVYDINFNELHTYPYTEHSCFALVNGQEYLVQIGNESTWNNGYYLIMLNLETGLETQFYTSPLWCGHISSSVENWITVSEGCVDYEIFNYNILTGEKRSLANATQPSRASVSRSMDKVVFSDVYAYVVESEPTLSIEEPILFNYSEVRYFDMLGRELNAINNRGVYIVEYRIGNRVSRKKIIK